MKIINRLFAILWIVGIISILLTCIVYYYFLNTRFSEFEQLEAKRNILRVSDALSERIDGINQKISDWSSWDDTYSFIQTRDDAFIQSNMDPTGLQNMKLSFMLFLNSKDQIVYSICVDLMTGEESCSADNISSFFIAHPNLLYADGSAGDHSKGIVNLQEGLIIFSSRPILDTRQDLPSRGTLVVGRFIKSSEIEELSALTKLNVSLLPFDNSSDHGDAMHKLISNYELDTKSTAPIISIRLVDRNLIEGYILLRDVNYAPAGVLLIKMDRSIRKIGSSTIESAILLICVLSFGVGLTIFLFLRYSIVSGIEYLSQSIEKISKDDTFRLELKGSDDFKMVSSKMNELLDTLAQSKKSIEKEHAVLQDKIADLEKLRMLTTDTEIYAEQIRLENESLKAQIKNAAPSESVPKNKARADAVSSKNLAAAKKETRVRAPKMKKTTKNKTGQRNRSGKNRRRG